MTRCLKSVLFDLDGTLIDSAPDLRVASNRLLTERGLQEATLPSVKKMMGDGTRKLVQRALVAVGDPQNEAGMDRRRSVPGVLHGSARVAEVAVTYGYARHPYPELGRTG